MVTWFGETEEIGRCSGRFGVTFGFAADVTVDATVGVAVDAGPVDGARCWDVGNATAHHLSWSHGHLYAPARNTTRIG